MSTIKSSDEHLTLNADGSSKDIKLQSNGSEKVIIKSDGKVGISTSAPSTNLEVEADDNSTTTFPVKVINSAGTGSTQIGAYAIDTTSVDLTLKAGGNTALTVDKDNGNVGINVTPATINKFQVKQATDINLGVRGAVDTTGSIVIQAVNDAVDTNIPLELRGTAVTTPLQPAFRVTKTSDQSLVVNGEIIVAWGSEQFDVGSNFSSNVFTAPVSGMYFFAGRVRIDSMDTGGQYYRMSIETSNVVSHQILVPKFTSDVAYMTMSVSGVFDMDAGDTADFRARQVSGTASHLDDNASYSNFCGYLLG